MNSLANEKVLRYLTKVKEFEANEVAEWMKNIIHLGGGDSPSQQDTFAAYLEVFRGIIADTLFGGNIETFLKTSSDPISQEHTSSISQIINEGATMITFFGHGAGSVGFDIGIRDPNNYANDKKYPLILANSCYVGDVFQLDDNINEDWIFNRFGAIGFVASTNLGYSSDLFKFSRAFYKNMCYLNYGESIGWNMKKAIGDILSNKALSTSVAELVLHGDPAIVLNSFPEPDIEITPASILVDEDISMEQDTFSIQVVVTNVARSITTPFYVKIERYFPDNSIMDYIVSLDHCYYKDTIELRLPVNTEIGAGLNKITVSADFYDTIPELSETNNIASLEFFIQSEDLIPVFSGI